MPVTKRKSLETKRRERKEKIKRKIAEEIVDENKETEQGRQEAKSISKRKIKQKKELNRSQRPSRKAALVAAKKIHNSVYNFPVSDHPANPVPKPKPVSTSHPYTRPKSKRNPPVNVDLQMECCDDFLSPIQAEFLLKAQIQYNMVMKNLRELMACDVKVIQTDANGIPTAVTSPSSVNLKSGNVIISPKSGNRKLVKADSAMVVPMILTQSPIIIN